MKTLNTNNNDEIRNELKNFGEINQISDDEVICSIVYEFASKLPYSMDYIDKDFVPGLFLNVSPMNPSKWIFKEYNSLYQKMITWSDTRKSGILLQICVIFQAMLIGQFSNNYQLTEEDFHNLGINQMTSDDEYNRFLFETLEMLPEYCMKLNSTKTTDERRKMLDDIYTTILDRVGQKIGGFRKTSIDGNIISVQEHKATIRLFPHRDLEMLYYFEGIRFGYDVGNLINNINQKIHLGTNQSNKNMYLETENRNKGLQKIKNNRQ